MKASMKMAAICSWLLKAMSKIVMAKIMKGVAEMASENQLA